MRINVTSIFVDNQEKALRFYTEILGFKKRSDFPVSDAFRWITVVSKEEPDGVELSLEPDDNPAVGPFKSSIYAQGIPFMSFAVDDVYAEHERLRELGVVFKQEPMAHGPVTVAIFDDTCGNLIQIAHMNEAA
ncbi:VOC family protein [Listeria booriae]|uniref:VOC family protein n=1 Tax=Listeria booriae TaxID=1552123 RepID=UPI0016284807|nr:VOC family protein [Listeria booriae]MBC2367470.1 VOC family protein [Listeria booriae]MBC2389127.1 VOC family protein [Listeria booriae]